MKRLTGFILAFLISAGTLFAQADIISAADFVALKKANKTLVVIDANTAANYAKSHVQGAINVPHKELYQETEIEGLIKIPAELAEYFGNQGVSSTSEIVIYDDGSSKYNSRVYWVLKYLGVDDAKLLHKNMGEWKKSRVPITRAKTVTKKATFTAHANDNVIVDLNYVKGHLGKADFVLIDSRDPEEFDGSADKSEGHIKGAIHMNYKECLNEDGSYKNKAELEAVAGKYGLTKDKILVFYCQTSVRAAVAFVAFESILDYPNVKVYDGAYNEWVAKGHDIAQ